MKTLVQVQDLLIRREGRTVLDIPRLDIHKREILAIVGPNGSGKSTLLLTLSSLLKPAHGSIIFEGHSVSMQRDLGYRRRIGLVMQEALLLNQSVFSNAALGLRFRGIHKTEVKKKVETWLERLGISHLRERPASQLSGGEARRVALVRAFVLEPDLLLLDEPFAALDRPSRQNLQEDLKVILASSHITTVFSTHSESDVQKLATRKIELEGGRLVGYD